MTNRGRMGEMSERGWFVLSALLALIVFLLLLLDGCGTFQRRAKDGSDERNHCFAYSQLCKQQGTQMSPYGHLYTESQLDLRCSRLDEDATLWGYSCSNYLP
jgi:hypothetical protein